MRSRAFILFAVIVAAAAFAAACGGRSDQPAAIANDTPTEAYKRLYNAVKAKDTDAIRAVMSKETQAFAEMAAQQQKVPVSKVYENGMTGTTFSGNMPEIRDERIRGQWGAVEVWNSKDSRWEDLPFVAEDGSWKLAVGESFKGTYKSPGKGRDYREKEAANIARGGAPDTANTNMTANVNTNIAPDPSKNKAK